MLVTAAPSSEMPMMKKGQDAKFAHFNSDELWGSKGITSDYVLLYMFIFSHKELFYFYRRKKNEGRKEGRDRVKRKILKDQCNISSRLTNIMAGKGRPFKSFTNISGALSFGDELHNKLSISL